MKHDTYHDTIDTLPNTQSDKYRYAYHATNSDK